MPVSTIGPGQVQARRTPPGKSDQDAESGGNIQRLERYGSSVIPVVGGIMQAKYGLGEMHADTKLQKTNGKIDVALGTSSAIGQLADIPLYAAPFTQLVAPALAIAGPIAGVAGVISSVCDGGRDIYNGIKLGNTEDKVIGAVKIGSGFLSATGAGATILLGASTANLPLMIAGTIIYLGAAGYQNREALGKLLHDSVDKVKHAFA